MSEFRGVPPCVGVHTDASTAWQKTSVSMRAGVKVKKAGVGQLGGVQDRGTQRKEACRGWVAPEWPWSDDTDGTWHLLLQMYSRDWMMAGRGEGGRARGQDFTNPSQGITSLGLDSGSPGKPLLICRQRRSSLERRVWRSTKAGK